MKLYARALCWAVPALAPALALANPTLTWVNSIAAPPGANEFSGLTYAGGTTYYAVTDAAGAPNLHRLGINLNAATGALASATLAASTLTSGLDHEGIAYQPGGFVFISAEVGNTLFRSQTAPILGSSAGAIVLPPIYNQARFNLSLESLALSPADGSIYLANEAPLLADSSSASSFTSTLHVRLQKLDALGAPLNQWAYGIDPVSGDSAFTTAETSGLVDLAVLPDGSLLALERELGTGGNPLGLRFRTRIYHIPTVAGATDISSLSGLIGASFTPLSKTLLWEGTFPATNFEGMAIGPTLDNGDLSLLLISDNGGGLTSTIGALRLSIPEPGTLSLLAMALPLALRRRRQA